MTSKRDAEALTQKTLLIEKLRKQCEAQEQLIEALYTVGSNHPHTYAAEDKLRFINPTWRLK